MGLKSTGTGAVINVCTTLSASQCMPLLHHFNKPSAQPVTSRHCSNIDHYLHPIPSSDYHQKSQAPKAGLHQLVKLLATIISALKCASVFHSRQSFSRKLKLNSVGKFVFFTRSMHSCCDILIKVHSPHLSRW